MLLAGDDGLDDGSSGGHQNYAGPRVEFDASVFEDFVNPVVYAVALLDQLDSIACQIAQIASRPGRYKAGPDEAVRQQLGNPLAVAGARLPSRDGLDLKPIGEDQLKMTFQRLPDRRPGNAGSLHPHLSPFLRHKPAAQIS